MTSNAALTAEVNAIRADLERWEQAIDEWEPG
jgi:hypothetical protein